MCKLVKLVLLSALLLIYSASFAVMVSYEIIATGEDLWEYRYTIENNGAFDIESISITFDSNLCTGFGLSSSPAISSGWDEQFFNYAAGLRIYDALAIGGNKIGVGETVSGFGVSFSYSGIGTPASQFFEIYNPDDYSEPLVIGWTILVPEPAAIILMSLGFAMLHKTKH